MQDFLTVTATAIEFLTIAYLSGCLLSFAFGSNEVVEEFEKVTEPIDVTLTINDNVIGWQPINFEVEVVEMETNVRIAAMAMVEEVTTVDDNAAYAIPEHALEDDYNDLYQLASEKGIKGLNTRWKLATIKRKLAELEGM